MGYSGFTLLAQNSSRYMEILLWEWESIFPTSADEPCKHGMTVKNRAVVEGLGLERWAGLPVTYIITKVLGFKTLLSHLSCFTTFKVLHYSVNAW